MMCTRFPAGGLFGVVLLGLAMGCGSPKITDGSGGKGVKGGGGQGATNGGTGGANGGGGGRTGDAGFTFNVPDGGVVIDAGAGLCTNLCLKQMTCAGGGETTVSGTVVAPTPPAYGMPDPIYNAIVYVPNAQVQPFPKGASCEKCGTPASGSPLVSALTGPDGKFTLKNVPVGDNIPLVIQVGRWRRQVTIPSVAACANTAVPQEMTRLPRNKAEGDIPLTAIATGNADAIECVLRKIGVDDAEFTQSTGDGRVNIYSSNGATLGTPPEKADVLTGSLDRLKRYDIVILECEGEPIPKAMPNKQNVTNYTNMGGRLFLTHYSYTWADTPPFSTTAAWMVDSRAPTEKDAPITGIIDQSFPKGMAFAKWLEVVGATSPMPGQIQINTPRHDVDGVVPPSQRWIYTTAPATLQHFTFNTPVGAAEANQCGRVVYSDFHVNDIKNIDPPFPQECNMMPMTAQEKVIEFMLFDLASCVQPDTKIPVIQ